jgi:hypothetical protein
MNREQMTAPFAEEELRTFEGRGGKTMTYIEDETVMDRLDAGYGYGNWQVQVEAIPYVEGAVKVRLGVREHGEWIWNEDFGYPNREGGESLKEAVSDGIRRCGRYFGIARDLYRKSTYELGGSLGPKRPSKPPAGDHRSNITVGTQEVTPDGGLIGKAVIQGNQDFNLRQTPSGSTLPFRIKNGSHSFIVLAENELAQAVEMMRAQILDHLVTVWGKWTDETIPAKGVKPEIKYRILHLTKLQTPDFILPSDVQEDLLPQPPDDVSLVGEAPTAPLFDELPI